MNQPDTLGRNASAPPQAGMPRDAAPRVWGARLLAFSRAIAVIQLLKGLYHWASLIGVGVEGDPLAGRSTAWVVATVYFSVVDLVAAVGLWVGAAWGVVIWLLAAVGQILVGALTPHAFGGNGWTIGFELAAMVVYVTLSTLARREALD